MRYTRLYGHAAGWLTRSAPRLALVAAVSFGPAVATANMAPLVVASADAQRQSFLRIVNHSPEGGAVRFHAFDDAGVRYGPITLSIDAHGAVHFNSKDLESGNSGKGLSAGIGQGSGDWRLEFDSHLSDLDIGVLAYMRTTDGFLTSMSDLAPEVGGKHQVAFFNPGSNDRQVSRLRVINLDTATATVTVTGIDDAGNSPGDPVRLSVPAFAARTLSARELESGEADGLSGALGDGAGKWRLRVESDRRIGVMSLLDSPTGHLANLSTAPDRVVRQAPLFLAVDRSGREGFARVINHSDRSGTIHISAIDDAGEQYGPAVLEIAANAAVHFNSRDLERGNAAKGLTAGLGAGSGAWRLSLESSLDFQVLAYVRTADGFVTSMHDLVPERARRFHVATFNPGENTRQISRLRLINPGDRTVGVRLQGVDDGGASPGGDLWVLVPALGVREFDAQQLESGMRSQMTGALGDGAGKWWLTAVADGPLRVMSLLESPSGHLTNLSSNMPGVGFRSHATVSGRLDGGAWGSPVQRADCTLFSALGDRPLARAATDSAGAFVAAVPAERPGFLGCVPRGLPALRLWGFVNAQPAGAAVSDQTVSPRTTMLALLLQNELAGDPDVDLSDRVRQLGSDLPGMVDFELLVRVAEELFEALRDGPINAPFPRLLIDVFANGRTDDSRLVDHAEALDALVRSAEEAEGVRLFAAAHRVFADLALLADARGLGVPAPAPPLPADPDNLAALADDWRSNEFGEHPALWTMNAHWAYARELTGVGEVVGMTDSGLYAAHEEFAGRLHDETVYTMIGDAADGDKEVTFARVADGPPDGRYPTDVRPDQDVYCEGIGCKFDLYNHGTAMASAAVGARNGTGAHGLAFGAKLLFRPDYQYDGEVDVGAFYYHPPDRRWPANMVTRHDLVMQVGDAAPIVANAWLTGGSTFLHELAGDGTYFPFHEVLPRDWHGYQRERRPQDRALVVWSAGNQPIPGGPLSGAAAVPSLTERQARAASGGTKGLADHVFTQEELQGLSERQALERARALLGRLKRRWLATMAVAGDDGGPGDLRGWDSYIASRSYCATRGDGGSCELDHTLGASSRCGFASDWCIAVGTVWGGVETDLRQPPRPTSAHGQGAYLTSEASAGAAGALAVLMQAYRGADGHLAVGTSTVLDRLKATANPDLFAADARYGDGFDTRFGTGVHNILQQEEQMIRALIGFAGASDDELRQFIADARDDLADLLPGIPDERLDQEEAVEWDRTPFSHDQQREIEAAKDALSNAQWARFRVLNRLVWRSAFWRDIDTFPPQLKRVRALLRDAEQSVEQGNDLLARLIRQVEWIDEQLRRIHKTPLTVTDAEVRKITVTSMVGHGLIDLKAATDPNR